MNFIRIGAILGALGVVFGAFGAHGLQGRVGYDLLEIYKTGSQYLILHAFAIILFGLSKPQKKWPGILFLIGIAIFSGSLFAITFTGIRALGAITPIGGVSLIIAWTGFALGAKNHG